VRRVAATDKEARFTALVHHVDVDREQLIDHLVSKAIPDRVRKLERLAAGGPLRSPSGLAPRPPARGVH